jgi:preprotein translocase subunit SecY
VLTAFVRAFRTPDLRRKILFTLAVMALFRLGSFIPTPGVDYGAVQKCVELTKESDAAGLYKLVNLFSGGALCSCPSSRWASCPTSPRASSFSC